MAEDIRKAFRDKAYGKVFPAVPTPWTKEGKLHDRAQEAYAGHLAATAVGGAAVWAHTGRGLHIPREARLRTMRSWREAFSDGRLIIAGVGAKPDRILADPDMKAKFIEDTKRMAEDAVDCGADAFLVYAPIVWRDAPDQDEMVYSYHKMLCGYGKPIVLFYLYREAGGISYGPDLLCKLLALPQTVAMKVATLDSVTTFQDVEALIRREQQHITLVTGEDRMVGYTYMCGAESALIGMASACTVPQVDMTDAWFNGEHSKFVAGSAKVDTYSQVTFAKPLDRYIIRMLWSLVAEGVIPEEAANDPMGCTIDNPEISLIRSTMEKLGWLGPRWA